MALVFLCTGLCFFSACGKKYPSLNGTIDNINKHGNVTVTLTKAEMADNGYEYGDIVTVTFAENSLDVPYCSSYSDVDAGSAGIFGKPDNDTLVLAVNGGSFAAVYGIADKKTFDDGSFEWIYREGMSEALSFGVSMKTKRGYYDEYVVRQLTYTDERSDYPGLSDEEYANFRAVSATGIRANVLFRSSSPIDPDWARRPYADAAAKEHGVNVILDLADDEAALAAYEGYDSSCFGGAKHLALNMGMDYTEADFREKLKAGLRFIAENEGVYLIHCKEGKSRTGFVIALLEFLMGAGYDEAEADYMLTYRNYYGVVKGDEKYGSIASANFEKMFLRSFAVGDVRKADLKKLAEYYIKGLGLTDAEIAAIRAHLAA
ncbi:MAG: tyrosine-protein phosphatase [Clostridia bacterium]|nr:tyrosine-protein phosphatase [Clostridia bacterium]